MSRTTIAVDEDVRDALYYLKQPDESYEDFLRRAFDLDELEGSAA